MANENDYYFTINTSDEKFYLCKVQDSESIFTTEEVEGMTVLTGADFADRKFIQLISPFVVVATPDGPIPVEYGKMPGGSKRLWVNVDNIASFNVIDKNSKLVMALDQILSGIVTEAEPSQQPQKHRYTGR